MEDQDCTVVASLTRTGGLYRGVEGLRRLSRARLGVYHPDWMSDDDGTFCCGRENDGARKYS